MITTPFTPEVADFAKAWTITLTRFEKGYVNDPHDPGGETKFGISKRAFPDEDIANLTPERAGDLAKRHYWYPLRLDTLNDQALANNLFDFAFHHGATSVALMFQEMLTQDFGFKGVIDGILGAKTMGFLNELLISTPTAAVLVHTTFAKLRMEYYLRTAKPEYLKGFITRALYFL